MPLVEDVFAVKSVVAVMGVPDGEESYAWALLPTSPFGMLKFQISAWARPATPRLNKATMNIGVRI